MLSDIPSLSLKNQVELSTHSLIFPVEIISIYSSSRKAIRVKANFASTYLFFLKHHVLCQYEVLTDITAIPIPETTDYEVAYELLSLRFNNRLSIKVNPQNFTITSVSNIYYSATWGECELWDMYGIFAENHERLSRLLTDYGFEGYPLRKDFPLSGYYDVKYNEFQKRIIADTLELSQEYRMFDYKVSYTY